MNYTKKILKKITVWSVIFSTICWSAGISFSDLIKNAYAMGGIEVMYTGENSGFTDNVGLSDVNIPESIIKIIAYETVTGDNKLNSIMLRFDEANDCFGGTCSESPFDITDLGAISATASSGISLWQDDGDGTFELYEDTLLSDTNIASAWTVVTDTYNTSNSMWQTTFSGLNLSIPTTYGGLVLFVAVKAENNLNADPMHKFFPMIPQNGIDVTAVSGATITDFPYSGMWGFPEVSLGEADTNMMYGSPVLISEIQTAGETADDEFVELYNRSPQEFDLSSWSLQYRGSESSTTISKINLTGTIPANGFYLITKNGSYDGGTTATLAQTAISLSATGGTVFLVNDQNLLVTTEIANATSTVDKLAWGIGTYLHPEGKTAPAPQTNGSLERKAFPSSTPSSMIAGGIDSTKGNSEDFNDNGSDFILRNTSDPQNTDSPTETGEINDDQRSVVINEVLYNTSSGNGWIELYNAKSISEDIENFTLQIATSTTQTYTIPAMILPPQAFTIVYINKTGTNDLDSSDGFSSLYANNIYNLSVYGGDITLKNSSAEIIDYIQYGGSGKAGEIAAFSAGQWNPGDFIQNSNYNESIARKGTTGDDYNGSGDWMYMQSPTPGFPNAGGDSTAPTAVTNVLLADNDALIYGLDGNDIRITWTPATSFDSTFDRYEVYLLPENSSLDQTNQTPYANIYEQYAYELGVASATYLFTGNSDFRMKLDSTGNSLANGNYRAYVVAVDFSGNRSTPVSSSVAILASDAGVGGDTSAPMIDFMSVWSAKAESDLTFILRAGDDRGISSVEIPYKVNDGAWGVTTATCSSPAMSGEIGLYSCVISWDAGWDSATTINYYIKATDTSSNIKYMCIYPTNSEAIAKENSINIVFKDSTNWNDEDITADLSGKVYNQSGESLQDAFIFVEGTTIGMATTTADGFFTFADNALPEGTQNIKVMKSEYMDMWNNVMRNENNLSFYLSSGYINTSTGGDSGENGIAWTAPMDGMMMAPININCDGDCSTMASTDLPIIISFFNEMNSTTIDDGDASNSGSNIYVTADGNTKIPGKVKYVYNSPTMNEARFYSSTPLNNDTFYTVVITPEVKDINGNPIKSNQSTGNYEFSFSTMPDGTTMWDEGYTDFGGGGMYMPPYVIGTNPTPGKFNVPLGAILTVEFSEGMDPTSISNNIKLYKITDSSSWSSTLVSDKNVSVSLDSTTKKIATITHNTLDDNASNNGWYEIKVMAGAKSQLGVWMGDPVSNGCSTDIDSCLATKNHYSSSFQVATSSDTTPPTIAGTYPKNNDGISNSNVVDVAISVIEIGFSEAMNPSTINSQNITLKQGTVSVAGNIKYDPMSNNAKFSPSNALSSNNVYTLTVAGTGSSGVADLSGNYLANNYIATFKTGSADTVSPEVMYANGDDYQIAITFSEPMNASLRTDTDNWAYSVLNPLNYFINGLDSGALCASPGNWSCDHSLVAPYNTADGNQISTLSNITISYDNPTQTAILKGFNLCNGANFSQCVAQYYQIFIDNVKDKSGNVIADTTNRSASGSYRNASRSPLQNSASTYGILGPGGGSGMMMGGGGPGSETSGNGPGMDMGKMGMFGAGAFPMNAMAGQTSSYMIDIPLIKPLRDGMQVVLTFPTGFNVSSVTKDLYSSMNNDMNEKNPGIVTWDTSFGVGGIASTTSRVVTIKFDVSGTVNTSVGNTNDGFVDFLHIDLKNILNTSIPKDFGTSGYTVDIKTKSSDGAILENIQTMPFFITEGGLNSLTVVTNCGNVAQNTGTIDVFLGSPMTGPMEAESTIFINGIATSTFSNLISGDYKIFTDPVVVIDGTNYIGKSMPEPIQIPIDGGDTKNITITKEDAGAGTTSAEVTVYLQGDYSTDSIADDVDIFANSPSSFRVKTLSDVGSTNPNTTFYLTEGSWMMGVGPAVPKGPMSGPPPMPDWMEPQMININIGIETATSRNLNPESVGDGDATTSNARPVLLNVNNTNNFQIGNVVTFGTGVAVATTTITSIISNASITVTPQGNWATLPSNTDTIFSVRESSNGNNDSKIFFNISTQSLKNINGYVLDESGNALSGAEVYAYQPQGFGGGHTSTDTNGRFTLKIGMNGVWTIGASKPGIPNGVEKSVEVKTNSSNTDGNLTADIYLKSVLIDDASNDNSGTNPLQLVLKRPGETISGKVLNSSGQAVPNASVWAYQPTGWGHSNTMTDSSGNYILYVDQGTWQVEADAPNVGWMQYDTTISVVSGSSQSNINLRPSSASTFYNISGTVSIDGSLHTYMPIRAVQYDVNGNYLGKEFSSSTDANGAYAITAPEGYYRIDIWTQNYGEVELAYDEISNSPANLHLTAATTTADILIASSDLKTVSLQFTNGTVSQNGFLHIEGITTDTHPKPTGFMLNKNISGLSATSTIKLKTGHYIFFLDVPGLGSYIPTEESRNVGSGNGDHIHVSTDRSVYFTLTNSNSANEMITVSGTVKDDSGNTLESSWVWVGSPNSFFRIGEDSDANGNFSLSIPKDGGANYQLGADKPGYMPPVPISLSGTSDSENIITITSIANNSQNINGTVKNSIGTGLANAMVWAEEVGVIGNLGTGKVIHTQADSTGAYSLPVTNGVWNIQANVDGYVKSSYKVSGTRQDITINGISQSPAGLINFTLTASIDGIKSKSKSIVPASGGTIDDTTALGTKMKLTIPPNALGSSASTGNINVQQTSAVTKTNSSQPFGNQGTEITATNNSGQAITNLDDNIDMQMVIYKADVDTEITNGNLTYDILKTTNNGYWDSTSNNWVNLTTTRTAYYKTVASPNEWILYTNASSTNAFNSFIDEIENNTITATDYKLVFTSQTNHFTVFAIIMPFVATAAQAAPTVAETPAPAPSSPGGSSPAPTTYCTIVQYGSWQETCSNNLQYRNVESQSPSSCILTTNQEANRKRSCSIEEEQIEETEEKSIIEKITDKIQELIEKPIDITKGIVNKLTLIASESSEVVKANISSLLDKFGLKRNLQKEQDSVNKYVKKLLEKAQKGFTKENSYALTNFIVYGTETTLNLGEGERAGVINSYESAFGKIPATENEWSDALKIANGRWPSARSSQSETNSEIAFKKIYLRNPDRNNPNDDAAVTVIAYGLRPDNRNLNSEKNAIKIFKSIYGYNPSSATAWDIVRAIAYSGATR